LKRDFLSHKTADRKAQHVDSSSQRLYEGYRIRAHLFERGWDFSGGARDAGVIEQDHFSVFGKTIGYRRAQ
jgi:hypothetical protein